MAVITLKFELKNLAIEKMLHKNIVLINIVNRVLTVCSFY